MALPTESSLRRHTVIFGSVATLISLTDIPLYLMYTGGWEPKDTGTVSLGLIIAQGFCIAGPPLRRLSSAQAKKLTWRTLSECPPRVTHSELHFGRLFAVQIAPEGSVH